MGGADQRRALTAVERALENLGRGDRAAALEAAHRAEELDAAGHFEGFVEAVEAFDGTETGWGLVARAVGEGPLAALVERYRSTE